MRNMYAWVPWFRELSARIAEGGERGLIECAKRVEWTAEDPYVLRFGDEYIDPLSFLNYVSSALRSMESVHEVFEMDSARPQDEDWEFVFPMVGAGRAILHGGEASGPGRLWELFRQARPDEPQIKAGTINSVLKLPGAGVYNLTSALCLINASKFLPIGRQAVALGKKVPTLSELGKQKKSTFTLSTYEAIMRQAEKAFPGCRLYEIGRFLYEHDIWDTGLVSEESSFFHISTKLKGDKGADFWNKFERENAVWTSGKASAIEWDDPLPPEKKPYPVIEPQVGDIMLVRCGTGQGRGIGVVLSNDFAKDGGLRASSRIHVVWINKAEADLAQPAPRFAMDRAASADKGAFPGFKKSDHYRSSFDLFRALDVPMPNGPPRRRGKQPLNQILYGPPGTGKTWNTVARAVAIIEDRSVDDVESEDRKEVKRRFDAYREAGQVEMTTFHQNYAYEDFIEGIRPSLGQGEGAGLGFELNPGALRRIADAAERNRQAYESRDDEFVDVRDLLQAFGEHVETTAERVWLRADETGAGIYIDRVGRDADGEVVRFELGGRVSQKLHRRVVLRDYRSFCEDKIKSYKGIKPVRSARGAVMGQAAYFFMLLQAMKRFQDRHGESAKRKAVERKDFVLILDEINRGNIARIFGELITLVEESRRLGRGDETKVTLPYSGEEFGVPENLYLIGTMNTADRSIALLDTALRRRFEFVEMMPDSSLLDREVAEVHLGSLLDAMNERIRFLRDREHQIGHTYFLEVRGLDGLRAVFQKQILPLLQEYFYDDWAKIAAVLGNNGFVESVKCPLALKGTELVEPGAKSYELLRFDDPKWGKSGPYQRIYSENAVDGPGTDEAEEKGDGADVE